MAAQVLTYEMYVIPAFFQYIAATSNEMIQNPHTKTPNQSFFNSKRFYKHETEKK